ncbi:MAG: hypothetical protein WAN35_01460 [Terracidiphilus sp.]
MDDTAGQFCVLTPLAVTVLVFPSFISLGLAEHLIGGGSNALTVKNAVAAADSHGFKPSLTGLPSFTPQFNV